MKTNIAFRSLESLCTDHPCSQKNNSALYSYVPAQGKGQLNGIGIAQMTSKTTTVDLVNIPSYVKGDSLSPCIAQKTPLPDGEPR